MSAVLVLVSVLQGVDVSGLWYSTALPGVLGSVCTSVYISVPREVYVAGDFGIALTLPGVRGSLCTSVGICVLQGIYITGNSLVFGGLSVPVLGVTGGLRLRELWYSTYPPWCSGVRVCLYQCWCMCPKWWLRLSGLWYSTAFPGVRGSCPLY